MQVRRIKSNEISFQYSHPLKTAYKKGLMPEVVNGLYGEKIVKPSIEHLTPHSQGGKTTWNNVAITDAKANNLRGVRPIEELVTKEMWKAYLKQFINVKNKFVDGLQYIKIMCKRFQIDIKEIIG